MGGRAEGIGLAWARARGVHGRRLATARVCQSAVPVRKTAALTARLSPSLSLSLSLSLSFSLCLSLSLSLYIYIYIHMHMCMHNIHIRIYVYPFDPPI